MSHRSHRHLAVLCAMALLLGTPDAGRAAAPEEPATAPTDITSTDRGARLTVETATRFTSHGVPTEPTDLTVLAFDEGTIVIVSATLAPALDLELGDRGEIAATLDVGAGPAADPRRAPATHRGGPEPAASGTSYWSLRAQGCLASLAVDSARLDSCWYIYQLINDGSSRKSYWTLRHKATALEYESGLRSAWIRGAPTPRTASQAWVDWGPEQGHTGSCSTVNVGVTHLVTLSHSVQACETWSIDKSCNSCAPSFKNTWDCTCWFGLGTKGEPISRAVAYQMLVSTSQSSSPRFRLGIGMAA